MCGEVVAAPLSLQDTVYPILPFEVEVKFLITSETSATELTAWVTPSHSYPFFICSACSFPCST